jgi:DNA-binding NtrC family response regulator
MVTGKRILVVDSDAAVLFVYGQALQALGTSNEIVTAPNGFEAVDEFRKKPFDLVITGLKIARMDGIELTEAIKALKPETAVIWITAHGARNFASDADRLGVICCRDKPLEIREILQLVEEALSNA